MSYTITQDCIGCRLCLSTCPTGAIQPGESGQYRIDASLCNRCEGFYSVPQCMAICPANHACVPDAQDYWANWFVQYHRMVDQVRQADEVAYWDQWFDRYSQRLSHLLTERSPVAQT